MATMSQRFTAPVFGAGSPALSIGALAGLGAHLGGRVLYVRGDGATYEFPDAYGTLTAAITAAQSGDTIVLLDDIREEVTVPNTLFDLTILGAGTRPRHDDKHNFPSTRQIGTASWRNSSGVTATALCTVRAQGLRLINILFDAPASAACLSLIRNASSGEDEYDASHLQAIGCRFASGATGIDSVGMENVFNVLVEDCTFQDLTDGIKGANAYRWEIRGNRFLTMTNCIDVAAVECAITDNVMVKAPTKGFDLTGGSLNTVARNVFAGDYNVLNVAGTTDQWGGNYVSDESAGLSTAVPTGS